MRSSAICLLAVFAAGGCAAAAVAVAPVGPLVRVDRLDAGEGVFLGSAACRTCHEAAYARWRATAHAREYAGLTDGDRQRAACLRCHVTGYGESSGYRASRAGPDLANVGCETCHGPGSDHARSARPELVPTLTGGACPPCEVNRICRLCHTPEHSAGFELSRDLARITCKR